MYGSELSTDLPLVGFVSANLYALHITASDACWLFNSLFAAWRA